LNFRIDIVVQLQYQNRYCGFSERFAFTDGDVLGPKNTVSVVEVLRAKTKAGPWTFESSSHWCNRKLVVHGVTIPQGRDERETGAIIVFSGKQENSET
jgi:hypothetical protein